MVYTRSQLGIDRLKAVSAQALKPLIDRQEVMLIDVREATEHAEETIAGSTVMPLSRFEPAQVLARVSDSGLPVVLYCRTGNRSAQAAQQLFAAGAEAVMHLEGGLLAWKSMNYPTVVNPKAPMSLMRQVQIVAGSLVVAGTLLGGLVSPWFLLLSGFVGAGLVFAGVTNTCGLAMVLAKMPWNQQI